jgi:hypothetical protein
MMIVGPVHEHNTLEQERRECPGNVWKHDRLDDFP